MKNKHYIKLFSGILGVLVVIVFGVCFNLFFIGEPIDGAQLHYTISENNHQLDLHVEAVESAVALKDWKLVQEGSTLYISARKVLVSPFYDQGDYETSIDLRLTEKILLGGQVIWSKTVQE